MNLLPNRPPRAVVHDPRSANDRFKEGFRTKLGLSLLVATTLHVVAFEAWPVMYAEDVAYTMSVPEILSLPPEVEIPAAPARIARPAAPVASTDVSVETTLDIVGWSAVEELPPPPPPPTENVVRTEGYIPFTPYTVAPRLLNPAEMEAALQAAYPPTLRDAGVGGTVMLLMHIDENGQVLEARVRQTSPFHSLDETAIALAPLMRFSAALNRDKKVAVWITMPLIFEVSR